MSDPDLNQQILAELRSLRRSNQWGLTFALLVLCGVCVYAYLRLPRPHHSPWDQVAAAREDGDYTKALRLTKALSDAHPSDYYGHQYLGIIYLAMGDTANAEREYVRAYELKPTPDIQEELDAVRKRRKMETAKPSEAGH